jgi:hypothetical protein
MSIEEIKRQIFEGIDNIDDSDFLMTIKELVDHKYSISEEPKLADWQRERIHESENQIRKGDYLSNSQANELFDRWLNE